MHAWDDSRASKVENKNPPCVRVKAILNTLFLLSWVSFRILKFYSSGRTAVANATLVHTFGLLQYKLGHFTVDNLQETLLLDGLGIICLIFGAIYFFSLNSAQSALRNARWKQYSIYAKPVKSGSWNIESNNRAKHNSLELCGMLIHESLNLNLKFTFHQHTTTTS